MYLFLNINEFNKIYLMHIWEIQMENLHDIICNEKRKVQKENVSKIKTIFHVVKEWTGI
jgi:hypothetical protein